MDLLPLILSYICNIAESKDMSEVKHGVSRRPSCVRCLKTTSGVRGLSETQVRRSIQTMDAWINSSSTGRIEESRCVTSSSNEIVCEGTEEENDLQCLSLSSCRSFQMSLSY